LTIIKDTFTAVSANDFVSKVNDYLVQANWISNTVANGYKLLATSPQGLQIYLYVRNLGHTTGTFGDPQVTFNFETLDGMTTGIDQEIAMHPGAVFVIIAGKSYFRIATIGVSSDIGGSFLIGEIPFIPDENLCDGYKPSNPTDKCFISMGDHNGGGSPRTYLILGSSLFGPTNQISCEALWGTDYCAEGDSIGSLRMPLLTCAPFIFQGFNVPSPDVWATGDFWRMEPFLVWGTTNSTLPLIRAQSWDSMHFAKAFPMDKEIQMDKLKWYVFTDNYFYGVYACLFTSTGSNGVNTNPGVGSDFAAFLYD